MVRTIQLPIDTSSQLGNSIPSRIIDQILVNSRNVQDIISFSYINKKTYDYINNGSSVWVSFLKKLNVWTVNNKSTLLVNDLNELDKLKLNPTNCLNFKINNISISKKAFITIYSILSPLIKQLLIENYTNFQNLNIFNQYNTPLNQSKLFTNIGIFLTLYSNEQSLYNSLTIRLNTILNLFLNSIISEIDIKLNEKNYKSVLNLIVSLDNLNFLNDDIQIDPLESLLEFFITKYNDDYIYLLNDNLANECFIKEDINNTADQLSNRGIVKGFSFNFNKIDEIFDNIEKLLNNQLLEIKNIFDIKLIDNNNKIRTDIDEIPIILKIMENFLNNYLIGGLVDRIINKAKNIDSLDTVIDTNLSIKIKEPNTAIDVTTATELETAKPLDSNNSVISNQNSNGIVETEYNHWNDGSDIPQDENSMPKKSESANSKIKLNDNKSYINLMNEESLFFQCVPYIHSKLISTLKILKYPETEIILNDKSVTKMNYIKVICEFVNFYYEQYLIEFSDELPKQCHISLIQLICAWRDNNQKSQKQLEIDILKLVDDEDKNDKKLNFEIFSTFTNLFSFGKNSNNPNNNDINSGKDVGGKEEEEENQVKLTKMAAKLKILTTKVESLKSLISLDLTILLLQHIKNSYDLLLGLTEYSTTEQINKQIHKTCINIFNDMLNLLINNHIKPGFIEALNRLKNFNPMDFNNKNDNNIGNGENITDNNNNSISNNSNRKSSNNDDNEVLEPVNNFIELVDVGDLILQMINVFYNHELVNNNIVESKSVHNRDFLKMNNIEKSMKLMESTLDTYVADGLDISINIIIMEIRFKIEECIGPIPINSKSKSNSSSMRNKRNISSSASNNSNYSNSNNSQSNSLNSNINNNHSNNNNNINNNMNDYEGTVYNLDKIEELPLNNNQSSEWCNIFLKVLKLHFTLLQNSIDKTIMDVFKQELGDRLIILLIQLIMKKFKISTIGGIQFSYDINLLYDFYKTEKIKPAIEYLIGFKQIDQMYLVDCSSNFNKEFKNQCKELGKLIIDLGRLNNVFTPEEVYQFLTRRSDWNKIKKYIDKVVYGLGTDDCIIM